VSAGCSCESCRNLPPHPTIPGKHIDPKTGILPIHEWGEECGRGWVSESRFGTGPVIKRTNRKKNPPGVPAHA
jgi:hypothetical protein